MGHFSRTTGRQGWQGHSGVLSATERRAQRPRPGGQGHVAQVIQRPGRTGTPGQALLPQHILHLTLRLQCRKQLLAASWPRPGLVTTVLRALLAYPAEMHNETPATARFYPSPRAARARFFSA